VPPTSGPSARPADVVSLSARANGRKPPMQQRRSGHRWTSVASGWAAWHFLRPMPVRASDDASPSARSMGTRLGVTLIDTAEVYGPYTNEELVGRAIRRPPRRSGAGHQFSGFSSPRRRWPGTLDSSPAQPSARLSRARSGGLDTDHIRSLYQHRVDPAGPPSRETVGSHSAEAGGRGERSAASVVGKPGSVRSGGGPTLSTGINPRCSRSSRSGTRDPQDEVLAGSCVSWAIGSSPTRHWGAAFLTRGGPLGGRHSATRDSRKDNPGFVGEGTSSHKPAHRRRSRKPNRDGTSGRRPAQVALAWLLAQGGAQSNRSPAPRRVNPA